MRRDRIIEIKASEVKAINDGVIVKDTMKLSSQKAGLIYLPTGDRLDFDKQFEIGEVVSVGNNVPQDEIKIGDVILYRRLTAFWLPNGLGKTFLWKVEYPFSILVVIPSEHCGEESPQEDNSLPDLKIVQSLEGYFDRGLSHYI